MIRNPTVNSNSIYLTTDQLAYALRIAHLRQEQNLAEGRRDREGARPEDGLAYHETGALGEVAVAVMFGMDWDGKLGDRSPGDVGPYEVRTTRVTGGSLRLRPTDPPERVYILVTVETPPLCIVVGWMWGHEALRYPCCDRWGTGRTAHWVPAEDLHRAPLPVLS